MFRLDGGEHTAETDMHFCEARLPEILARIGELVPKDHAVFPHLVRGETHVMRISDFISRPRLHRTDLYNGIMNVVEVEYQTIIPAGTATHAGGLCSVL